MQKKKFEIKQDNDLEIQLIFTDGSENEEYSDVGAEFVVRKINVCQIRILRSVDYSRKYMLLFSSRNAALKSDLE